MTHLVRIAAAALLLAGALPAAAVDTAPAPAAAPPADPGRLSGAAAWATIVGNTIDGKVAGEDFADYFDPSGAVRHVDQNGLSSGTWALQGDKVCLDFPDDDERSCLAFEVAGGAGTAVDDDGTPIRFTVRPGNSKGL